MSPSRGDGRKNTLFLPNLKTVRPVFLSDGAVIQSFVAFKYGFYVFYLIFACRFIVLV